MIATHGSRRFTTKSKAKNEGQLKTLNTRLLLGEHGKFRQLRRGYADALEAFGDDAVGCRQQADEQIHRRHAAAAMITRPGIRIAQQTNHVIRKEFAIEHEERVAHAFLLVK